MRTGKKIVSYDPDQLMPSSDWLATDEGQRIELVAAYHQLKKTRLPNAQLHAVIHVVVENQLALGEKVVVDTLARLQSEGLSRHDAIHAIGSVLAVDLYELMKEGAETTDTTYQHYLESLQRLTAEDWRREVSR